MIVDYHVHTPYCGHAQGKMAQYVEAAIAAGVSELGFSDHLGRYYLSALQRKRYWDWGMPEKDVDRYFSEALDLKELYADRITIRIGLEVDYIEGAEHIVQRILNRFPFDYVLGSIHCIPTLGWHHISQYVKSNLGLEKIYDLYFSILKAALSSGLFQSIAHPDFIWRYFISPAIMRGQITAALGEIVSLSKKSNTALEINANGYLSSFANYKEIFNPFIILLSAIAAQKADITMGSDAHAPLMVAKSFPEITAILKNSGITSVSVFNQKKRSLVKLD